MCDIRCENGLRNALDKNRFDILLINPSYHRRADSGIVPSIGLAYLASILGRNGFTSRVIDCSLYFDRLDAITIDKIKGWLGKQLTLAKPRLAIGIGPCTTSAIRSIVAIADTCKKVCPSVPLIFGGPLTLIPDQEMLFFERLSASAVVKGDGEYALCSILHQLQNGNSLLGIPGVQTIKNIKVEPDFLKDLDSYPLPLWDAYDIDSYKPSIRRNLFDSPFAPIIGSRGFKGIYKLLQRIFSNPRSMSKP